MKNCPVIIRFHAIVCFGLFLAACQSDERNQSLEPDQFASAVALPGAQLLDVRTVQEYQTGHLKDASLAEWKNQPEFRERIVHLDKGRPILVYCAAGTRSAAAADWLIGQGFEVKQLRGGIKAWQAANQPIEQTPNAKPISMTEYSVLTNLGRVVLVDIGADWCPPCKKMEPVISQLQSENPSNFKLVKVDAGTQTELMKAVGAEKIPTFIVYKNGIETWRKEGLVDIIELKQNLK